MEPGYRGQYTAEDPEFETGQGIEIFLFSKSPKLLWGKLPAPPTAPSSFLFSGYWRPFWGGGGKLPGRGVNSPSSTTEGKNEWRQTSASPVHLNALDRYNCTAFAANLEFMELYLDFASRFHGMMLDEAKR